MGQPIIYGDRAAREVSAALESRLNAPVADTTALAAIPAVQRFTGTLCVTADTCTLWVFDGASSTTASSTIIAPAAGSGRWRRVAATATS